jgi:protein gp37
MPLELVRDDDAPLTAQEKKLLQRCETMVAEGKEKVATGFVEMAEAFYQIREQRLYRETHPTFAAYFQQRWGYKRTNAKRIADDGEMIARLAPRGAILEKMTSDAHFRPLAHLADGEQDTIVEVAEQWLRWKDGDTVAPSLIRSARLFTLPPGGPSPPDEKTQALVRQFTAIVEDERKKLPAGTPKEVRAFLTRIVDRVSELDRPRSSTGIAWTEATWNPLQGCAHVSAGCDRCYAAKLIATRMADLYPGLAVGKAGSDGVKRYRFTNKIVLLPEDLGQPLQDRTPKRFFVNSMSDLFHSKVPDDFIEAVFKVMEKAHWHQYQVLTKRPERMADFSRAYFKRREPPPHIWLGTSVENQEAFDERIGHLCKTKAAVRWLSCEPLLGPIRFDSPEGIGWVVVGGESDSNRPMEKGWATSLRDQCAKAKIPYFFKQWGSYDEEGNGPRKESHDSPPMLDGKIHHEYPGIQ